MTATSENDRNIDANIDPRELAKFEALASRWWDPQGEFKTLHDINPLRLAYVDKRVHLAGKQVLDVGCGGGILAEAMAERGATVEGIDMGAANLEVARLHGIESGIAVSYHEAAAEAYALEHAGRFDVVTCMELLEHVPDPSALVAACARLARPGGNLFFSTLNRNPKAYLLAVVGAEYLLDMLPKGTHDYARFIRPSELAHAMRQTGLDLMDLTGLSYGPLSGGYRLTDDVSVNYLAHARRM